jgi:hypothetical protein
MAMRVRLQMGNLCMSCDQFYTTRSEVMLLLEREAK